MADQSSQRSQAADFPGYYEFVRVPASPPPPDEQEVCSWTPKRVLDGDVANNVRPGVRALAAVLTAVGNGLLCRTAKMDTLLSGMLRARADDRNVEQFRRACLLVRMCVAVLG